MTRSQIASGATAAALTAGTFITGSASTVLLICSIVISATVLAVIGGVMLPAVWSRTPVRRQVAYDVLRLIFSNLRREDAHQLAMLPDLNVGAVKRVERQLVLAPDQDGGGWQTTLACELADASDGTATTVTATD